MNAQPLRYDYTPHPKQAEAHQVLVDEMLFGGAAGGGKSRWARAEAVTLALQVPGSRIVLFRRTFPDLQRSVEEEFKKEIPQGLGTYNHSKHEWRFANGSIIELAHLSREDDIYKYQGAEYQLVIFEEATHFTLKQYLYLKSRLRSSGAVRRQMKDLGLRPRLIATANPGGVGHHWVKARFVDPAPAGAIFRTTPTANEPRPGTRCYIPSRVTDNPSVNSEYVDMLNALPENQRRALRDGDWDVLDGVRFKDWRASAHVIRAEQLPVPITTGQKVIAVDYGMAAPFAAVWMVKLTDDMVVIYREAYLKELTPTQQAEMIRDLSAEEEARSGEKIPVVCDPSMWNRATAGGDRAVNPDGPPPGSPAHAYKKVLGRTPLKAVNARVNGWALVDEHLRVRDDGLPRLLVHDHCVNLIRTLPALPRDKKNPDDVDTTAEDHLCFVTGTMISTEHGQVPIEQVGPGDQVWTRAGLRQVTVAGMTQRQAPVGTVTLEDGRTLTGTGNHPVFTPAGTVPLDALRYGDTLLSWNASTTPPSDTEASSSAATPTRNAPATAATTDPQQITGGTASRPSTRKSGRTPTDDRSRKGITSIMQTMMWTTTPLRTWCSSQLESIWSITRTSRNGSSTGDGSSISPSRPRRNGTVAPRAGNGTGSTDARPGRTGNRGSAPVTSARRTTRLSSSATVPGSAPTPVSHGGAASPVLTMSNAPANPVGPSSPATGTTRPALAPVRVASPFAPTDRADVYNLTVEGEPEYFANGVLVHNCDSLRYGLMHLAGKRVMTARQQREAADALPVSPSVRTLTAGLGRAAF